MKRFALDAEQTDAILELKIYRLARLEILVIQQELADKRKRAKEIGALLKSKVDRWKIIRDEIELVQKTYGDARRTEIVGAVEEQEYTAEDFIIEEDNVVIVTRDGWVKRQKEVKDIASTRVREGDAVLAVLPGSTRASVVFFTNFGTAYTVKIADVPASTGYGEPIQSLFKFKDGEKVVGRAESRSARVGVITLEESRRSPPPVHAVAATSDGYSLRFSLEPFVEPSTRAGRRVRARRRGRRGRRRRARSPGRRSSSPPPGRRARCSARSEEINFLGGPGPRRHPHQAAEGGRSPARLHRVDRRPRPDDRRDDARGRADDQHGEVRGDRPRRQGPRTPAARPVHARRPAPGRGAGDGERQLIEEWSEVEVPHPFRDARRRCRLDPNARSALAGPRRAMARRRG